MGKTKKLYLARRMLALMLAAAISVTMVPSTAFAAPADEPVAEDSVNDVAKGNDDVDVTSDADQPADSEASEKSGEVESAADGEAADADDVAGVDNGDADATKIEDGVEETEKKPDDGGNVEGKAEVNAAEEPAAALSAYEIVLDGDFETDAVYNAQDHFTDIKAYVSLKKDGEDASFEEAEKITCTWKQKGADESYAVIAAAPKNAGTYQAVLSYPKQDGVHDGAELFVDCEIAKADATITLEGVNYDNKMSVKPGTKRSEIATPVINSIYGGGDEVETTDVTLDMKIKDAVTGVEAEADTVLTKDGDYVMTFTPAFKEGTADTKKNNYELKPFTVDIEMADLIGTMMTVKLTDKWKQEGEDAPSQITKEYDGTPVSDPKEGAAEDYTFEVSYEAQDGTWKKLEGADVKAVGEWEEYTGCEVGEDGKVKAPTEAGSYYYDVIYEGEDGVYAGSEAYIPVEIAKAELKVEAVNTAPLTVPENITAAEVLARVEYKVTDKAGKDVTADVKARHIWGTSYSNSGKSQIYEPLFTLQESSDGTSWTEIDVNDMDYTLSKDLQYRVTFTGRKAVLSANGSYGDGWRDIVEDINSDNNINGVDLNYNTISAEGKELAVKVEAGTKAVIDVSGLLGEYKGAKTIAELKAKQYDGVSIYTARSQYKNQVKLKTKEGAEGTEIKTEQREFTYTWARYTRGDRIDAAIAEANQTFGEGDWRPTKTAIISPKDAGVYRLTISYEDMIDPDTYNYADDAVVYFAIDPKQVKLIPKEPEQPYEVLAGYEAWQFFYEQEPAYDMKDSEGKEITLEDRSLVARGKIVRTEQQTAPAEPVISDYDQDDYGNYEWGTFESGAEFTYQLRGVELRRYDSEYGEYVADPNYTCYVSEMVTEAGVATRKDTALNTDGQPITVVPMGTEKLTITVDPTKWAVREKVYDAKPFEEKELITEGLVTVSDAGAKLTYKAYDAEWGFLRNLEDTVDAGHYTLYACFDGDKKYAPYSAGEGVGYPDSIGVKLGTFEITPREIALKAGLDENYVAGTYANTILGYVQSKYEVLGYVPDHEAAFTKESYSDGIPAWGGYAPAFEIAEAGSKTALGRYEKLKRNKKYEVRYDRTDDLTDFWWDEDSYTEINMKQNYRVKNEAVAVFETKPGNSSIASVVYNQIGRIAIQTRNDKADPMKREVTMQEAIRWSKPVLDGERREGNFVAFQFTAPAEYDGSMPATAMYENAIKGKGGYVVGSTWNSFTAVFNAGEGDKTFQIRWEDGYVESYTLKFAEAVKLENLEDAVAPKALAFNSPNKKMAVGQDQQLDVKITKEQMGDVIYLGYKSDDTKTLVVDESGRVTALKIGSATVTVFPQHLVNDKPVPIPGAKTATLKIQVTKLDAPKKLSTVTHGTYVDLNYDSPNYGYRREIYVVKKSDTFKKAEDFENTLKGMKENQWKSKGFAIAPIYINKSTEDAYRKSAKYVSRLQGLDVKTDYTIYVRNVCAVRTLTDGTGGVVTQAAMNESASGAVVNVKTKKAEIEGLDLWVYSEGGWDWDHEGYHRILWLSKVKNGVAQMNPRGLFPESAVDPAADRADQIEIPLPFAGEDKAKYKDVYEEPKLEYALAKCYDKKTDTWGWGTKNDYASIDKKGKIKFTGIPREDDPLIVRVHVVGTEINAYADFSFWDNADSVAAAKKSVTLSVGQGQDLGDLLTYNLGKMKLTAYPDHSIDTEKVRNAIKSQNQSEFFTVTEGGYLRAVNGGGKLELELTDKNVEKISGTEKATVKVTFSSKELEPVKSLKACDVTHNNFGLTFSYSGYASSFLLEVSDTKKPIYSKVLSGGNGIERLLVTDKDGKYVQRRNAQGDLVYDENGEPVWTWKQGTYEISDRFIGDLGIRLYKDSQYTVSLTPIYGANKAKPATAKVKTTKIPVQDEYLENGYDDNGDWIWGCDRKGGMGITVSEGDRGLNLGEWNKTLYAVSGNTYTLTAEVDNKRGRVSDTLVWTVGDAKVASVKAAAGTYCITLTGLKPGKTTLEVKSKLLGNKVIARYDINVGAVKNAWNNAAYYGENEPD